MESHTPNAEALEKRRLELIQIINDAFDGVSREGGVSRREARVLDDCGSDQERAAARALDTESRWQDVPLVDLQGDTICSFLDPLGFRCYAPVFMTFKLIQLGPNRDPTLLTNEDIMFHFSPSDDGRSDDWRRDKFRHFTPVQGGAVRNYLEFVRDYNRETDWEFGAEGAQKAPSTGTGASSNDPD